MKTFPKLEKPLEQEHLDFLTAFARSCRKSIIEMVTNAQSGHPGGSLSSIDYLVLLYTFIISQTGEPVVVSHGHISPAVYSVLAELDYTSKKDAIATFRQADSIFEGHISRHVPGVIYGTGPLGVGVSAGSAFALAEKLKKTEKKAFCLMGDGETQEGQVHEMMNFAAHHKLDNFILFVDYNKVQLTGSIKDTMGINIPGEFSSAGWEVIEMDAHDFQDMWRALGSAYKIKNKPILLLGHSIMGKGAPGMEEDGVCGKSIWHGKPPKPEMTKEMLPHFEITDKEQKLINDFKKNIKWKPEKNEFTKLLTKININTGKPITYTDEDGVDCRTAYGKALLDLAKLNNNILALTADLSPSVMTKFVAEERPEQHIECGIAEQQMVTCSGGLSFSGFVPFCSTFGAFLTSRPKDQARMNDINNTNVKMVATHCGLSVGEDGPSHQAIDDAGTFLGHFNTMIIEPADPNHTDHIIRYIASHYGNFYIRMGRHKFPNITKENGSLFYDENYKYEYGKTDIIRSGNDITIAATGVMVGHALEARNQLIQKNPNLSIEIIAVSSMKKFDDTLIDSIKKTKKLLTVEDHNTISGFGSQIATYLQKNNIQIDKFKMLGIEEYQLSGKCQELYRKAGLDSSGIANACLKLV